ncbi:MAG: MBL fold metallo-hydrolase [Deltaproteobacteria bacterium]|nr:MBL fold metallo-hydrolase [Deltaproteobacteria bacterium]
MKVKQIRVGNMEVFCYLVGDEATKTCALVDPAFETDRILEEVKSEGYTVTHVINTHGHFDHTSGNAAIIAATQAKLLIHKQDAPQLKKLISRAMMMMMGGKRSPEADVLLEEEDVIEIGETTLTVIHTPGHTNGGICLYAPGHVFTGDTLFVGFVGRTDLPGGSGRTLGKSIREKLFALPEDTVVWPGHDYGEKPSSTVEYEKKNNNEVRML